MIFSEPDRNLVTAARDGNVDALLTALAEDGDPGKINPFGQNALNHAIKGGHLDCVRLLLESGANPNLQGPMTPRPLFLAEIKKNKEMQALLAEFGAL